MYRHLFDVKIKTLSIQSSQSMTKQIQSIHIFCAMEKINYRQKMFIELLCILMNVVQYIYSSSNDQYNRHSNHFGIRIQWIDPLSYVPWCIGGSERT